ncbi:unnamed protein product [Rotaria sordida]|uniref:Nuclear protein MDM1 n=1 Tax=Rotaria sordida TaxID=392033 RepID=A0A818HZ91_9BILA|nr:unnamed protein product [Rotaria sordida]CAF3670071.1 unnamed protein product [Rotaria sordida]
MKYQTEYQRNYQNRSSKKFHELSVEEQKLSEVPIKRSLSSPTRRRRLSPNRYYYNDDNDFVVIGPNDKFSQSSLYRLKQPFKNYPRIAKPQEYVVLGRNQKFEDNAIYKLRNPVINDSPRVVIRRRRRKNENHSCGIQTELDKAASVSHVPRHRKRIEPQSEYKHKYINWKQPPNIPVTDQKPIENSQWRDRRSDLIEPSSIVNPSKKISKGVNTPSRLEIDVHANKQRAKRTTMDSTKLFRPKRDKANEYRACHRRIIDPRQRKAFEAEEVDERRRKEFVKVDHAYTDDEDIGRNIDLGDEFRQKYPHGKLRRWKSEYQATYKPFWRFDYKNGKWYKDTAADETGFNPNLFWYKELMATRKRANEYRTNAEKDHFNRDYSLQLQAGFNGNNNYRAWDDDDSDTISVISIDRDLERERIECERRREKDARRKQHKQICYDNLRSRPTGKSWTFKTDQTVQTEHPTDRIVYIDEPPPKQPGVATKAFVRNLGSSSIQQHMSWDSESIYSQETNSDIDSCRKNIIRKGLSKKQESRGTGTHSPMSSERQQNNLNNDYISSQTNQQTIQPNEFNTFASRSATTNQASHNATGRPSYDTYIFDKRPYTSMNEYCSYPGSRFKDEVTEYYYGRDDNRQQYQHTPVSKSSFQNHLQTLNGNYGQTYHTHCKDDDVLSVNSARSLTSSCSLASQTLERAQQNMNKYWSGHSPTSNSSPKKPCCAEN